MGLGHGGLDFSGGQQYALVTKPSDTTKPKGRIALIGAPVGGVIAIFFEI